jgi:hypothetical protein
MYAAPAPEVVSSLDELKRLRDENEVVFLFAVPRNGPRPPIESAFASVAEGMKHSHAFVAIQAELLDRDFTYVRTYRRNSSFVAAQVLDCRCPYTLSIPCV